MALAKEVQGVGIRSKCARPVVKYVLKSPYRLQWPQIDEIHNRLILQELKSEFTLKLAPRKSGTRLPSSLHCKISHCCLVGINAVTRALEKGALQLVLVCRSVCSSGLTDHLIPLCSATDTPACAVNNLSKEISSIFKMRSVLALGFKVQAQDDIFRDLICLVSDKAPDLTVPWEAKRGTHPILVQLPNQSKSQVAPESDIEKTDLITDNSLNPNDQTSLSGALTNDHLQSGPVTATRMKAARTEAAPQLLDLNVSRKVFLPKSKKRKWKE